jgi:hypothetical protein
MAVGRIVDRATGEVIAEPGDTLSAGGKLTETGIRIIYLVMNTRSKYESYVRSLNVYGAMVGIDENAYEMIEHIQPQIEVLDEYLAAIDASIKLVSETELYDAP